MAKMTPDRVKRTGSASTSLRQLVAVWNGEPGKRDTERTLGTPINKVAYKADTAFRSFGGNRPIEQYAFEVAGKFVERFADATALVLKRHHVQVEVTDDSPTYVKRALAMIAGTEEVRYVDVELLNVDG